MSKYLVSYSLNHTEIYNKIVEWDDITLSNINWFERSFDPYFVCNIIAITKINL